MTDTPLPTDLSYSAEHEWVAIAPGGPVPADAVRVGITTAAVDSLGEIVFVELPEAGAMVTAGEPCGEIESTKAVSELFSPVSGEVVAVNPALAENPSLVNEDPFGEGWLFAVRVEALGELKSAPDYATFIAETGAAR
ncbi:glycine cleavage system protein GcvH [Pseudonocardia acidicola]|uniref:Glycine cleavage system H protein n=1 Tax=Pseudonocardia acidicola TaxID=2724939 RepID=A0ABX1SIG4_9PSEU|nr:glycine cleavage system protein GcvH [Pseudonocardia acidicola]NMH99958.1 glycine cleavage system protein GcvH [Pseudonocardia acidicola]